MAAGPVEKSRAAYPFTYRIWGRPLETLHMPVGWSTLYNPSYALHVQQGTGGLGSVTCAQQPKTNPTQQGQAQPAGVGRTDYADG